jgi:hypothetical protein
MSTGLVYYTSEISDAPFEPCFPSSEGEGEGKVRIPIKTHEAFSSFLDGR